MSKDGFLERWSRRKLARTDEPGPEPDRAPEEAEPVAEAPAEETLDEAELARLPSLESFTLKTDLAPFLRQGVPHALRNAAMRKMWMLDPAIRDHKDLAVDYAWDWNTPGGVPGNSGTISRDSVARMLEGLNPKPKDPAAVVSEPADTAAEEPVAGPSDAEGATEGAEHQPQTAMPQVRADPSAPFSPEADRTVDRAPRPRKHGGAAPV